MQKRVYGKYQIRTACWPYKLQILMSRDMARKKYISKRTTNNYEMYKMIQEMIKGSIITEKLK